LTSNRRETGSRTGIQHRCGRDCAWRRGDGECVAGHPRCYGRGHQILDLEHYLDVLEKPPAEPRLRERRAVSYPQRLPPSRGSLTV